MYQFNYLGYMAFKIKTNPLSQRSIPDDNKISQVKDKCRETNDGTPSMCSSFSDLDGIVSLLI